MSYINFKYLNSQRLDHIDLIILQACKQNSTEDNSELLKSNQESHLHLIELGLVKLIKGKKGQTDFEKLRITPKGTKLLENVHTPEITENDIRMYDYLVEKYLSHEDEDRIIGNKKKTKIYCSVLRNYLSLNHQQFYWLCMLYLDQAIYTKKLENIFLDSNKVRYGTLQNNVDESPLYQYYDKNKEDIINFWKKKGCYENNI